MLLNNIKHIIRTNILGQTDVYSVSGLHYRKCIYIHIPKTGGVYINKQLYGNYGIGHRGVSYLEEQFGSNIYNYFVFTVVRDPVDRVISGLNYLIEGGINGIHRNWANKYGFYESELNSFILNNLRTLAQEDIHFKPQIEFLLDADDHIHPCIDFIGKFEEFDKVVHFLEDKMGIKFHPEKRNVSKKVITKRDLESDTIQFIKEVYRVDYNNFYPST